MTIPVDKLQEFGKQVGRDIGTRARSELVRETREISLSLGTGFGLGEYFAFVAAAGKELQLALSHKDSDGNPL